MMWKNLLVNLLVGMMLVQSSVPTAIARTDSKPDVSPAGEGNPVATSSAAMKVSIRAVSNPTIAFKTQNGRRIEQNQPESRALPHLVLKRNGFLTPGYERTLHITLSDLAIPASAANIALKIETQHGDPDLGGGDENRIVVWQDAIEIEDTDQTSFLKFPVLFDEFTNFQGKMLPTPTDYFRTTLTIVDREGRQLAETVTDFAFLMENQWQVPLPELAEQAPGAAPNRLAVYFCDMFPFVLKLNSPDGQLQRAEIERYIQVDLIPEMVEAIRTQTNEWGFPWYAEWANYRNGEDPKTLSVALTNSDTWYHGPAPSRGHAEISIRVDGSMLEYETLTDGIMSTFHHELFHNLQRNISMHFGGHTDIDGADDEWEAVSEGTAVLASSVGQPVVQFESSLGRRPYLARAKAFIGMEGAIGGDLNQSYKAISYHAAIYWRFLYEQCGGMNSGVEDTAAGMKVIRTMLEALYTANITDVTANSNIVTDLPQLMDDVLSKVDSCPFVNYADSLQSFARTIYSLKLEDGRCFKPGRPSQCGFYDPNRLYPVPPVRTVNLTSATNPISGEIPSSYGMDFIDVLIDGRNAQSLRIELVNTSGAATQFSVQIVPVLILRDDRQQPGYMVHYGQANVLTETTSDGSLVYTIDGTSLENVDCLGLIVTRLDDNEQSEAGEYELTVQIQ